MTNRENLGLATRRSMLVGLGAGFVALAASAANARQAAFAGALGGEQDNPELRSWKNRVGSSFAVEGGGRLRVVAVKAEAHDADRPAHVQRKQGFTVLFEGAPATAPEGDRIYRLSNLSSGTLPVYLGTAHVAGGKAQLAAVFN